MNINTVEIEPSSFFASLADPTRLRLVELLAVQPAGCSMCVKALAHRLGVSQPAVSQHLQVLRGVGLVHSERRGVRVHYFLDRERLRLGQSFLGQLAGTGKGSAPDPLRPRSSLVPDEDTEACR